MVIVFMLFAFGVFDKKSSGGGGGGGATFKSQTDQNDVTTKPTTAPTEATTSPPKTPATEAPTESKDNGDNVPDAEEVFQKALKSTVQVHAELGGGSGSFL